MAYYKTLTAEQDLLPPDPSWSPVYWTGMKSLNTQGDFFVDFAEAYLTPPRGNPDDWRITDWQRWLLRHVFELNAFGMWRYKKFFFFIPRKNGKSFMASLIALGLLCTATEGDQIAAVATSAAQARIVFDEARRNFGNSKFLPRRLISQQNVMRSKVCTATFKPLAFSIGGAQGLGLKFGIADELHAMDGMTGRSTAGKELIDALVTGSKDREEWMLMMITTAGANMKGVAYEEFEYAIAVATGEIEDETYGCALWMAEDADNVNDPATWRKANPNIAAGLMKESDFESDMVKAEATGSTAFERYHLNKWIKFSHVEQFINPHYLERGIKLGEKIPEGAEICVGFDGSQVEDASALVGIDVNTGLMEVLWVKQKAPGDDEFFVSEEEVKMAMACIHEKYTVLKLIADPARYKTCLVEWMRLYGKSVVRDIPNSPSRMKPAAHEFREDLYANKLFWNGDHALKEHFESAYETSYGTPKKQRNSTDKIDILMAAIFANQGRREVLDRMNKQKARDQRRERRNPQQ